MKTVLLVAFHYPPVRGSSGLQRTLRYSEHLSKFGWQPIVLSVDIKAYEAVSSSSGSEAPRGVTVSRAFGLDAARHLSLGGRYPRFLSNPDRWATWRFRAVPTALKIIRENRVNAIWSTFPIATAHLIGLEIARRTKLPWIAEFRDPMWQGDYPYDPVLNRSWLGLEQEIFRNAKAIVVTTPGAASLYRARYPDFDGSHITLIENGFDEGSFQRAEFSQNPSPVSGGSVMPVTLLHSGIIYPSERDPAQFFAALAALKSTGAVDSARLRVVLRASGNDLELGRQIAGLGIEDIVTLAPAIDYESALREMMSVDGLLVLQAANCNAQIPAKIYEYFRARRPILALTDAQGDTARTLRSAGTGLVAPLDSKEAIQSAILEFMAQLRSNSWSRLTNAHIAGFSRESRTEQFAELLDSLT